MTKEKRKVFRKDLIPLFASRTGLTKKKAEEALDILQDMIFEFLCEETDVYFTGFGTFWIRETSEREARNPRTKESHVIPAGYKTEFKMSRGFRDAVDRRIKENMSGNS